MVDVESIFRNYDLGQLISVTPASRGRTTRAWVARTDTGSWVLRRVRDQSQADLEYAITTHVLRSDDVVPRILPTRSGSSSATVMGELYNVQQCVTGAAPAIADGVLHVLGERVGRLHRALRNFDNAAEVVDRFAPARAGETLRSRWASLAPRLPEHWRDASVFEACAELQVRLHHSGDQQWIHADLGVWNVVWDEGRLPFTIDFAEARRGCPLIDCAAALTSMLGVQGPDELSGATAAFRQGYENAAAAWNQRLFEDCVRLWLIRGFLAAATAGESNASLVSAALHHLSVLDAFDLAFRSDGGERKGITRGDP